MTIKENIKELISTYNDIILTLEAEIKGENKGYGVGNGYLVGRRSALINVVDDLDSLLEDMEDQE